MSPELDPGALLARHYSLPHGPPVRLRLVRPRDADGIRALFDACGQPLDEVELARLVTVDLVRRRVIVATALIDARETVIGLGTVELDEVSAEPTVRVDPEFAAGLEPLLEDALRGHAATIIRARAA